MPDDTRTVNVVLPVDQGAADILKDDGHRTIIGKIVSQMLQPAGVGELFAIMDQISAEARRQGLTHEILEEELAAYNAERRDPAPHE